jgi:beta-galactosidase
MIAIRRLLVLCIASSLLLGGWQFEASLSGTRAANRFPIGETDFLLDGHPLQLRCGEVHSARIPREYWRNCLKMYKALGLNTVCG